MAKSRYGRRRTEHNFSQVPKANIPRSAFNRSHGHKTTIDAGYLYPILVDEVLPGDTHSLSMSVAGRFATLIYPLLDNVFLDFFFFFVPMRLVWDNTEKFFGAQTDPADSTDFTIPQSTLPAAGGNDEELLDYMGIPVGRATNTVNVLPFRCYTLIWDEWFRDQNLQDSIDAPTDDGPDTHNTYYRYPLRRGKRHDYFTSCLPWPSKGPDVELSLGDAATVKTSATRLLTGAQEPLQLYDTTAGAAPSSRMGLATGNTGSTFDLSESSNITSTGETGALYPANLEVDLADATAATINSLREAFQLQRMFERDARGGTRYVEMLKAHFGVISPDFRLQRPEYLGGGTTPLNVQAVPQTTQKTTASGWDADEKGSLSAFGYVGQSGIGFNKSFTEHGYIIGLVSARADLTYQTGLHKMWSRDTRYDFYHPVLANLGEQAVLEQEIYFQDSTATSPSNSDVFGYQERWAEYRYFPSRVSGAFRSEHATSLDAWHLAQDFDTTPPDLDSTFIVENPPVDRVIAVTTEPHFILDMWFKYRSVRPMPIYSVPGLIDHF